MHLRSQGSGTKSNCRAGRARRLIATAFAGRAGWLPVGGRVAESATGPCQRIRTEGTRLAGSPATTFPRAISDRDAGHCGSEVSVRDPGRRLVARRDRLRCRLRARLHSHRHGDCGRHHGCGDGGTDGRPGRAADGHRARGRERRQRSCLCLPREGTAAGVERCAHARAWDFQPPGLRSESAVCASRPDEPATPGSGRHLRRLPAPFRRHFLSARVPRSTPAHTCLPP